MLNPQPLGECKDERNVMSRFSAQPPSRAPSIAQFSRLQELLNQSLKREAETHKKMKHMYERLQSNAPRRTHTVSDSELIIETVLQISI